MSRVKMLWSFIVAALTLSPFQLEAQQSTLKDCLPVLSKDYYSYAMQNSLQEDFLKSIDAESWEQWKQSNDLNAWAVFSGGAFSLTDNYSAFDEKRSKYLETVHYNRTQRQALDILQITTSPRAYKAYEACLRSLDYGAPLRVWASSEDMDKIDLRVKYVNPPSKRNITLLGIVEGGSVSGAPAGRLWRGSRVWGVNQEIPFSIRRTRGVSETAVTVIPDDGSTPIRVAFRRADALLTLTYVGTTDIQRAPNRSLGLVTPNNNENRGSCPNEVGHHDGKYCTSRTTVTLTTALPRFLQNARPNYTGYACPYCFASTPTISGDGATAQFYIDNWGSPVNAILVADEYEHMTSAQCGSDRAIPVIYKQAAVLTALKECLPIATLKWRRLTEPPTEGTFRFGDKSSPDGKVVLDSVTDNGTALLGAYRLDQ